MIDHASKFAPPSSAKPSGRRLEPSIGRDLGKFLLDRFSEQHPEEDKETSLKWKMFAEIIMRISNDVAGNRYVMADDKTQFSSFDRIFEALEDSGVSGTKAFHAVLDALPTFTKGIVQTPHPTEVLPRDAIDAEGALHNLLESNHIHLFEAFTAGGNKAPTAGDYDDVIKAMNSLFTKIKPITKPMTPEEEMARSVKFSEVMFDALPLTMQTILEGAARNGAHDPSNKLDFTEISRFNFLLDPETWSPGDRDSKELMTAEMLKRGIELNERGMRLHYIKKLAEIVADLEVNPKHNVEITDQYDNIPGHRPEGRPLRVSDVVEGMVYRLVSSLKLDDVNEYLDSHLTGARADHIGNIIHEIQARCEEDKRSEGYDVNSRKNSYKVAEEFLSDLNYLRNIPDVEFEKYEFPDKRVAHFDKLDALLVQANNFGIRALRSQIRENAEMHENVLVSVFNALEEADIRVAGYDKDRPETAMQPQVINALLNRIMSDEGNLIHERLHEKLDFVERDLARHKERKDGWDKFYETLKGFEIAAEKPEAIPRYLIAECRNSNDVLAAFLLLKAMEPNEKRRDPKARKVEIVPLFEHRAHVENAPETMKEAYANEHFRKHHNNLTDPFDPAITTTKELNTPQIPPHEAEHISVKEAKERYGITPKAGDEDRYLKATKLVMYAGSDITKSAGASGAGLVMQTTNRMREMMLELPEPVLLVDYTGVGGGVHRSQPVATAYETAQGRSLRQTPQSLAQKILMQAGRAVRKVLGLNISFDDPEEPTLNPAAQQMDGKKKDVITAQLNMGNIAAANWYDGKETKERLSASMTAYQELYKDPTYSAYMGYTADPFVKLTSYAARSAARNRSKGDIGFPPLVDVESLRAIGYGAALNVSGTCAGLYFGASEFLKLDEAGNLAADSLEETKRLYLQDPIAQDRINRATYGVVMANMDTAWKYLGYERSVGDDGVVKVTKNGKTSDVGALAANPKMLAENPTKEEKEQAAAYVLAKIDREYQRVSKGILQLQREVKKDAGLSLSPMPGKSDAEQLLEELPKALKTQIRDSLWHLTPARHFLAERFNEIVEGKVEMPKRDSSKEFSDIYYAMGSMFETFENVPRAYTRLRWALDNELNVSKSVNTPPH